MKKCDCYYTEEQIIGWHTPVDPKTTIVHKCNGTRERDECSCGGDRTKCDFYPKVREKALKEQEVEFGKWIRVDDRLPEETQGYLVVLDNEDVDIRLFNSKDELYQIWPSMLDKFLYLTRTGDWTVDDSVTHWMPLPAPPTEKEN